MKNKFILTVMIVALTFTLTGCGKSKEIEIEKEIEKAQKQFEDFKKEQTELIQKQQTEFVNEREAQAKAKSDLLASAKVEGNKYTITNDSVYTFRSLQLASTEFKNDVELSFKNYSVATGQVKPGDTVTMVVNLSYGDRFKVIELDGSVIK